MRNFKTRQRVRAFHEVPNARTRWRVGLVLVRFLLSFASCERQQMAAGAEQTSRRFPSCAAIRTSDKSCLAVAIGDAGRDVARDGAIGKTRLPTSSRSSLDSLVLLHGTLKFFRSRAVQFTLSGTWLVESKP